MTRPRLCRLVAAVVLAVLMIGCGTTRMTDSPRAATEMLLVSQAVDNAVAQIDFSPLAEKTVYLDAAGVPEKDTPDRGYVVSLVRQQLLATGALLMDEKSKAEFIVELRVGGLGTDRHSLLIGTPEVSLPSPVPVIPAKIPEIAIVKKNDQRGVAKVAVVAYSRITGRALWQSGTAEAISYEKDTWVLGAGPISRGSIRQHTELAGNPLPTIPITLLGGNSQPRQPNLPGEQFFPNYQAPAPPQVIPASMLGVTGAAAVGEKPVVR
jgi:hypothetical protein